MGVLRLFEGLESTVCLFLQIYSFDRYGIQPYALWENNACVEEMVWWLGIILVEIIKSSILVKKN